MHKLVEQNDHFSYRETIFLIEKPFLMHESNLSLVLVLLSDKKNDICIYISQGFLLRTLLLNLRTKS